MSQKSSKQLVEEFLDIANKNNGYKFSSSAQRLAYERGLLTGLITSVLDKDTYAKSLLIQKINHMRKLIK